jgi:hypothetical protein
MIKKIPVFVSMIFCLITCLYEKAYPQQDSIKSKTINFYLDCEACDFTFVRQKLPFVSFVRDPQLSDVHILVSISHTGSGAHKYFLNFIGMNAFKEQNFDYELVTDPTYTEDDVRNGLLKILKIGILPYYSKTELFKQLNIDVEEKGNVKADNLVIDRWNKWIFSLSSGGDFQKEESQNEFSLQSVVSAVKITPEWKIRMDAGYEVNRENFYDDGKKIVNNQDETTVNANYIKSLTQKWSAGIFGNYSSSSFLNINNSYKLYGGVEYNFFPWDESNRRVFTLGYHVGISAYDYREETIYDKLKETRAFESMRLNLEMVEPWGSIEVSFEGRHLFHDFSKTRLIMGSDFSIRLTKQLSVYSEIYSQVIHDQLYLPKGDASLEDVLLKRRKLATTYEISGELGLRFTFGSIYSNVVNERF